MKKDEGGQGMEIRNQEQNDRNNTVNIVILFMVQLLERMAMVGMRTVITPYAKTEFLVPASLLGVLAGVLAVASMASRFSASGLMRRFSYLWLMRASLFAELTVYSLYLSVRSYRALVVVRLFNGFFTGISGTVILALAGTMFSVERMGLGLGIFGYSQMAAVGAAPALSMAVYNHFGAKAFFVFEIMTEAAALIMSVFVRADVKRKASDVRMKTGMRMEDHLRSIIPESAILPSFLNFFLEVSYASVSTFLIVYGQEKGWENAGLFFTIYAVGSIAVRPVIGALLDKKGLTLPVTICSISFALGLVVLARAGSFPVFLFSACLMTLGFGGGWSACQASALKCRNPEEKGSASAVYLLINDFGVLIGAILAGSYAELYGYSRTFLIFIIPIVMGCVLYYTVFFFGRLKKRKKAA